MGTWRLIALGWGALLATMIVAGIVTSLPAVVPPVVAASLVLFGAALAGDYFGFSRRAVGWKGKIASTPAAWARVSALELRFRRDRDQGRVGTGSTARALLVALAEIGELRRAGDVVDFLHADALTRAHRDVVGDGLRALALAELGRVPQARRLVSSLDRRAGREPVVTWARVRVAEREGRVQEALAELERAVPAHGALEPPLRDLALEQARLFVRSGATDRARVVLSRVASAGWRREVEALLDAGDPSLGLAVQEALGLVAEYR